MSNTLVIPRNSEKIVMEKYYGRSLKVILALGLKIGNFKGEHFEKIMLLNLLVSVLTIIQEIKFIADTENNLIDKFTVVPGILNCTLALAKFINAIYNRERIKAVMKTMDELFDEVSSEDQEAFYSTLLGLRRVSVIFGAGYMTISSVLCAAPLLKMLQIYFADGALVLLHPYLVWFPFDWDKYFISTYLYQCYCAIMSAAQSIIFDVLYTLIVSQIVAHFCHLKNSFKLLNDGVSAVKWNKKKFRNRFRNLIKLQVILYQQCDEMNNIFGPTYLIHFLIMTFSLCFSGFVIITQPDTFILTTFCVFITMVLNHTFILCWFGDKIESESSRLAVEIYEGKFYECDIQTQKDFSLVMLRSQRAQSMTATRFFKLEIPRIASILRTSYSYFAVLRQIYESK